MLTSAAFWASGLGTKAAVAGFFQPLGFQNSLQSRAGTYKNPLEEVVFYVRATGFCSGSYLL